MTHDEINAELSSIRARIQQIQTPTEELTARVRAAYDLANTMQDDERSEIRFVTRNWVAAFHAVQIAGAMPRDYQQRFVDNMQGLALVMLAVGYVGAREAMEVSAKAVKDFDEMCTLVDREAALLELKSFKEAGGTPQ